MSEKNLVTRETVEGILLRGAYPCIRNMAETIDALAIALRRLARNPNDVVVIGQANDVLRSTRYLGEG